MGTHVGSIETACDNKYAWAKKVLDSSYASNDFVGLNFSVYNGRKFIPVVVSEEMVGYKLGDFSPTRTYYGHGANKKAKRG